jgi:hypothetical protein
MTKIGAASERATLRVIDALDHPHGGRVLRVRALGDQTPTLRQLRGARFRAVSPDGQERRVRVLDFPLFWGKASDERIRATGRVDLRVEEEAEGSPVAITWELHPIG